MKIAVFLTAIAVLVAGCTSSTGGDPDPGRATLTVVCRGAASVEKDVAQIERRVSAYGGAVVKVSASGTTLTAEVRDLSNSLAPRLCAEGRLEFRPVLGPPPPVDCQTNCLTDLRSLDVVPTTTKEFDNLSQGHRAELASALERLDCDKITSNGPVGGGSSQPPLAACDAATPRLGFLLGASILSGFAVRSARVIEPNGQVTQWGIQIDLSADGDSAWGDWTTRHNTGGQSNGTVAQCSASTVPCDDFVAFVIDGRVLAAPLTLNPIRNVPIQVVGGFTRKSANDLAIALRAGPLSVPLTLVSAK